MTDQATESQDAAGGAPLQRVVRPHAPMRAVRLTLKLDADDMRELSYALRTIADHAERGELTIGVSGGPCSGYIYELLQDPTMTHDAYHAELRAYLDVLKQPLPVVCGNCDTALPEGCGGLFKDDGKHCRLNAA